MNNEYESHNNLKPLLQAVATNDSDCLSWPNTGWEMFCGSHGKHCFML